MTRAETLSYPISIFIAGDVQAAEMICRAHCNEVGLCVTVTPTNYIYTGGSQSGVIVGLINYPRFPTEPRVIWNKADELAKLLCAGLFQESCTIQAPDKTMWFSHRERDQ
jgi:ferredoxin